MKVPEWAQDAVWYQIFPDRFYNGEQANDPSNVQAWGCEPTLRGFMGGDLKGITKKFDYLLDLGINSLYLNPIFISASNHRYHANDYFSLDPTVGTKQDLKDLLDVAHQNQVRVVLDGVFNHTGRGFFAFSDILENGPDSRYKDWYHIHNFPLDAFNGGKATNYKAWWDIKDLPKLNTDNPEVVKYIMDVTRYWLEFGIDGWRLDVPGEIDDDDFWQLFKRVVKETNPDAYTLGEIWGLDARWTQHFDGLMHYPVRDVLLDVLMKGLSVKEFAAKMESFLTAYPKENLYAMYVPLGSHDTTRLLTELEGDTSKARLAYLIQFANVGAPAIYYGDEVGLDGGKDPQCRRAFPWHTPETWDMDLLTLIKRLIFVRKASPALRRGEYKQVYLNEEYPTYAFARDYEDETMVLVANLNDKTHHLLLPVNELGWGEGMEVFDQTKPGAHYGVHDGAIEIVLAPWSGTIIGNKEYK